VNRDRFLELTALYEGAGLELCLEDRDEDGDVDGSDLYLVLKGYSGSAAALESFAVEFGGDICP
jgi:hypothetical protein